MLYGSPSQPCPQAYLIGSYILQIVLTKTEKKGMFPIKESNAYYVYREQEKFKTLNGAYYTENRE